MLGLELRVLPIAFDSMGTRSMATLVETEDLKLLIDPGAALAPSRYGLPPHPREKERLREHKRRIRGTAREAEVIVISHYHYDHYMRDETDIYEGKVLLIKDPMNWINESQRKRADEFLSSLEGKPKGIEVSDGRVFSFGSTKIKFSPPFPHGREGTALGYVLMCIIESKREKVLFSSDVEGPRCLEVANWIIKERPDILVLDGPATMFIGWKEPLEVLFNVNKLLVRILEKARPKEVIIDHHLLRDLEWKEKIDQVIDVAKANDINIGTAAEFVGLKPDLLEARRRELYGLV